MKALQGKVFPSGGIEFSFIANKWASDWYARMLEQKKVSSRININPQKIPLNFELTKGLDAAEFDWLERISNLINSADQVYLRIIEGSFRFQKAIHKFSDTRQMVTLGASDVQGYAKKHWQRIKYFFAHRYEGFYFDVKKIVTGREGKQEQNSFELITKVRPEPQDTSCHLSFLATGSNVSNEIVSWRNSVDKGQSGRFSEDSTEVRFRVATTRRPLTFLHEYREEFKNHSYEFEGEQIQTHRARIAKRGASG